MNLTESINNSISLSDLQSIIIGRHSAESKVSTKLSFWGGRYIQALGYDGTADIDALAAKVIEFAYKKNFEFSQEERTIGKRISNHISHLYHASDAQVANANCLTRLFCFLRECTYGLFEHNPNPTAPDRTCSKTRWVWVDSGRGNMCQLFSYYTREQYRERFGSDANEFMGTNPFRLYAENPYKLPRLEYREDGASPH